MNEILRNIWSGLASASTLDQVNLLLGVLGVWLMIRRNLWAFPIGLAAVSVQGFLFYRTRIYADAALQVLFFVLLAWGWWRWLHPRPGQLELPVTKLSWPTRAAVVGLATISTGLIGLALARWTDALIPMRDAFIAAFSAAAQALQARKNLETWPLWIVVNLVAIPAYWSADLAYSAFLYLLYLVLAVEGWREWGQVVKVEPNHA